MWSSFESKLARLASEKKLALEWQKEELTMVVDQRLEELTTMAEHREEEAKIELLRRQMQRTQGYRAVASAWNFWCHVWDASVRRRKLLANARKHIIRGDKAFALARFAANVDDEYEARAKERRRTKREKLMAKLREAEMAVEAQKLATMTNASDRSGEHATFERLLTEQRLACDEEIKRILKANQEEKAMDTVAMEQRLQALEADNLATKARLLLTERLLGAELLALEQHLAGEERLRKEAEARLTERDAELSRAREHGLAGVNGSDGRGGRPAGSLHLPGSPLATEAEATYWANDLDESENAKPVAEQLANALRNSSARVIDLFRRWDANHDGKVSRSEFHRAMKVLGYEVSRQVIDELFNQWDADGGGELRLNELSQILSGSSSSPRNQKLGGPRVVGQLAGIDLDEGPDAKPISEQLADALRSSASKVVDLFRQWDANGDGNVSRAEFHKAMKHLGYDVGKKAIDQLFDQWDSDGGGELGLKELQRILNKASPVRSIKKPGRAALVVGKAASDRASLSNGGRVSPNSAGTSPMPLQKKISPVSSTGSKISPRGGK